MDGVIYHGSKLLPGSRILWTGCIMRQKVPVFDKLKRQFPEGAFSRNSNAWDLTLTKAIFIPVLWPRQKFLSRQIPAAAPMLSVSRDCLTLCTTPVLQLTI
jgi:hypothetical protein